MKRNIHTLFLISTAFIIIAVGCAKGEDTSSGDQGTSDNNDKPVFVTKADSIVTHGGKGRIEITWRLQSDSNVYSYKVSWVKNNHSGFVENKIKKVYGKNIIHVMVNHLEEGSYYFEIRMYNKEGKSSAKSTATGVVYGSHYQSALSEPAFHNVKRSGDDLEVNFEPTGEGLVRVEVRYLDVNGDSAVQFIPEAGVSYLLKGIPIDKPFKFQSVYLPDPTAIDTFYTNYLTAQVGEGYKVVEHYDSSSETYYYLTRINHTDAAGNIIKLRLALTDKSKLMGEKASDFASRMNAKLVFNASMSTVVSSPSGQDMRVPVGIQIINGKIVQERRTARYTLGIKDNNELVAYPSEIIAQGILDDNTNTSLTELIPFIENHKIIEETLDDVANLSVKNPRQVIAQFDNLDILFLTCGGRGHGGTGMTAREIINILKKLDVKFAYNLDGGGSISTVIDGNFINWKIDGHGTEERLRANFLYVK